MSCEACVSTHPPHTLDAQTHAACAPDQQLFPQRFSHKITQDTWRTHLVKQRPGFWLLPNIRLRQGTYLSGTFTTHQRGGFWHFLRGFRTFGLLPKLSFRAGGGGVCVYFLKTVRKCRFRNVWVGGGWEVVTFLSTELKLGRCRGRSTAQGTTAYSEWELS